MEELEISARTVEEAIRQALEHLGVSRDQVQIQVLKKGKTNTLGAKGGEAKIKVRLVNKVEVKADISKVTQETLKALLQRMGIKAEVQVLRTDLPLSLDIEGEDLGILIGRRGQTLACLEYIVRLIVAERLKAWIPLTIDVAGYKKRRREALESLALRLAEKVKTSRRSMTLEPMPASERRIIHLALANHPDVSTQSTGDGEERKVVILLKKK